MPAKFSCYTVFYCSLVKEPTLTWLKLLYRVKVSCILYSSTIMLALSYGLMRSTKHIIRISWGHFAQRPITKLMSLEKKLADVSTECSSHHQDAFTLMTTGAFSQNLGKLFSKLKLVTDNLSLYLCSSHWKKCPWVVFWHLEEHTHTFYMHRNMFQRK